MSRGEGDEDEFEWSTVWNAAYSCIARSLELGIYWYVNEYMLIIDNNMGCDPGRWMWYAVEGERGKT